MRAQVPKKHAKTRFCNHQSFSQTSPSHDFVGALHGRLRSLRISPLFLFLTSNSLPMQVVYAILGLYGGLILIAQAKSASSTSSKQSSAPAPDAPDYSSPLPVLSAIPSLEHNTKEWEQFVAAAPENFETWINSVADAAAAPAAH